MPSQGFTCTPGLTVGADGQESWTMDSATVESTAPSLHPDMYNPEGYVNEANGEVEYANDDGFEPEGMPISAADNQIMEGLMELFPDYSEALAWATANKPSHIAQQYNQALDNNEWSTVTPMLEQFIQEYRDYRQSPTIDEQVQQEVESMGFDTYEDVDDSSGVDAEQADSSYLMELADKAELQGDELAAEVLAGMAAVAEGDISQDEMNQMLLRSYDIEDITYAMERIGAQF